MKGTLVEVCTFVYLLPLEFHLVRELIIWELHYNNGIWPFVTLEICKRYWWLTNYLQGTIPALFEGQMESYIRCTQVDYVSSRLETFFDIQLNVKEKKNGTLGTMCVCGGEGVRGINMMKQCSCVL